MSTNQLNMVIAIDFPLLGLLTLIGLNNSYVARIKPTVAGTKEIVPKPGTKINTNEDIPNIKEATNI